MDEEKGDANNAINVGENTGEDEATGPVYKNNLDDDTDVCDNESLENRSSEHKKDDRKCIELEVTSDSRELQDTDTIDMDQNTGSTPTEKNGSLNERERVERTVETQGTKGHDNGTEDVTHGMEMMHEDIPNILPINGQNNCTADTVGGLACMDDGRIKEENLDEDYLKLSTTSHEKTQISNNKTDVHDTIRKTEEETVHNSKCNGEDGDTVNKDSSKNSSSKFGPDIKYHGNTNKGNFDDQEKKNQETDQTDICCSKTGNENPKQKGAQNRENPHLTITDKDNESFPSLQPCSLNEYDIVSPEEVSGVLHDDQAIKAMGIDTEKIRQERDKPQHVIDELKQLLKEEEQYTKRDRQVLKQQGLGSNPCEEIKELRDSQGIVNELRNILLGKNETISEIGRNFNEQKRRLEGEIQTLREEADNKDLQIQTEIKRSSIIQGSLDTVNKQLGAQREANKELFEKQIKLQMTNEELKTKANDYENEVQSQRRKIEEHEKRIKDYRSDIQKKEKKIEVQENVVKAYKNDVKSKEMQIKEQAKSMNKLLDDTQKLSNDKDLLCRKLQKQNKEIVVLRENVKVLEGTVKCQEEEKSKLNLRLSKLAGAHLTRDNPNIADLSDENRPTKIAEKFSELYDNEWTDAYEELCDKWELDERKSVDEMIRLLKVVDKECSFYSRPHREILGDLQTVTVKLDKLSSKNKTTQTAAISVCEKESSCHLNGDTFDEAERNHRDTKQTDPKKVYPKTIYKNIHEQTGEANPQELNDKKDIVDCTDEADIDSPQTKETAERAHNEEELKDGADDRMKNGEIVEGNDNEDNQTTTTNKRKNNVQEVQTENMTDEDIEGQLNAHAFKKRRCSTEIPPKSDDKENDDPGLERSNETGLVGHQEAQHGKETVVKGNGHTESRESNQNLTNYNKDVGEDMGLSENAKGRNLNFNHSGISLLAEAKEDDGQVEITGFEMEGQTEVPSRETVSTIEKIEDKRENETGNEIDRENTATVIYKREHPRNFKKASSDDTLLDGIEDGVGITISSAKSINHGKGETTAEEGEAGTNNEQHGCDDKGEEVEEELGDKDRHEYGNNEDNDNMERKDIAAVDDSTDTVENISLPERFSTCVDTGEVAAVLKIDVEFTAEQKKTVSDIKRLCTAKLEQSQKISEVIAQKVAFDVNHEYLQNPTVMAFIQKCAELCWFMVMQEPPVVVGFETETENVKFDKDRYKAYTKTGKKLDFVVWPPLYLHKDGAMLCKGTAQGKE